MQNEPPTFTMAYFQKDRLDANCKSNFQLNSNTWTSTFFRHIHHLPKLTALSIILRTSVASPPVSIRFLIPPIFHVWSQDRRHIAMTSRDAGRSEIWTVEPKCDINSTIRWFNTRVWSSRECRSEKIDRILRWD